MRDFFTGALTYVLSAMLSSVIVMMVLDGVHERHDAVPPLGYVTILLSLVAAGSVAQFLYYSATRGDDRPRPPKKTVTKISGKGVIKDE